MTAKENKNTRIANDDDIDCVISIVNEGSSERIRKKNEEEAAKLREREEKLEQLIEKHAEEDRKADNMMRDKIASFIVMVTMVYAFLHISILGTALTYVIFELNVVEVIFTSILYCILAGSLLFKMYGYVISRIYKD